MKPTYIHETIAQQLDHMKPPALRPGVDVEMAALSEHELIVVVPPLNTTAVIEYRPGPDLYRATVNRDGDPVVEHDDIYCDQLGELVFGRDISLPWRQPMAQVFVDDGNGGWKAI